jgi:hypothetical protein
MITRKRLTGLRVYEYYLSFNITLPPTPRASKWSVSYRSPHKNPVRTSLVSHSCHMHCPSQSSLFYQPWISLHMTSSITYTSREKLSFSWFQITYKIRMSSKSQSFIAVRQLLEPMKEFVKSFWTGRILDSCRWHIGTKQKFLLHFYTDYTT